SMSRTGHQKEKAERKLCSLKDSLRGKKDRERKVFSVLFLSAYKKVRNRSHAPKNANSDCCYIKPDKRGNETAYYYLLEFDVFTKFKSSMPQKGYNILSIKEKTISP
ncbi:MAG: hypothetical protein U0M06_12190, partial [Clostridia bacterium]|nr:hypothetical protein [Clostridia bacterium]